MKVNRDTIYITLLLTIFSALVYAYCVFWGVESDWNTYISNIILGVCGSSIVTFLIGIFSYNESKKKTLEEFIYVQRDLFELCGNYKKNDFVIWFKEYIDEVRKLEDCWANIWFLMDPRKHRLFLKEYVDYYGDLIQLLQDDYRILHLGEIPETAKNSILERINKIIIRNRTVDKGILKCTINENVLTSNMELTIKNINEIYRHRKVWTKYLFDKSLLNSDNFTILDYKYERYLSDIVKIIEEENSLDIKYMMPIKDAEYLMSKKYLSGFSYGENNMTSGISCRFIVDHYFDMKKRFEKKSD